MNLNGDELAKRLQRLGDRLPSDIVGAELLIVGAAAGILTGEFRNQRTTIDCNVIRYSPPGAQAAIETIARALASENNWAPEWFNSQAMELDILPPGWRSRRRLVLQYGPLSVFLAAIEGEAAHG